MACEKILEVLISKSDFGWHIIDASHIKFHPHAAGARGGNRDLGRTKGGLTPRYSWPWMRMCAGRMCITRPRYRLFVGMHICRGIDAEYFLTDKGYDSDTLVNSVQQIGINNVLPSV